MFFGANYESSDYTDYGTDGSWLNMIDDPEYENEDQELVVHEEPDECLPRGGDDLTRVRFFAGGQCGCPCVGWFPSPELIIERPP